MWTWWSRGFQQYTGIKARNFYLFCDMCLTKLSRSVLWDLHVPYFSDHRLLLFFFRISWLRPILQMRPIYCFIKFRDLKVTCNWVQIWKIMQSPWKLIHYKNISAYITWNRCGPSIFLRLSLKIGPAAYSPERPMFQKIWCIKCKIFFSSTVLKLFLCSNYWFVPVYYKLYWFTFN
jgi:hypothetical protein